MVALLPALLVAATVALALLALGRLALRGRLRVLTALRTVRVGEHESVPPATDLGPRSGPGTQLRAAVKRAAGALSLGPLQRWAERVLQGTGLPLRPEELLLLIAAGPVAGWLVGAMLHLPGFVRILLVAAGPVLPPLLCRRARTSRIQRVSTQLGDVLMTLGNGLRAGHSLLQALDAAATQSPEPLGLEVRRLLREIGAGIPVEEALDRLVTRCANADLELMVTAIRVQREVGGNLAEILDKISATIRARVTVKNHLRVITAQSRLSGIVVAVLPVAVFGLTTLIAPEVEHTLTGDPLGRVVAALAVLLECLGILAIRKVVDIKY